MPVLVNPPKRLPIADLPNGITCQDWQKDLKDQNGRRCMYYIKEGSCGLATHFMCEEWEKRASGKVTAASPIKLAPAPTAVNVRSHSDPLPEDEPPVIVDRDLFGSPLPPGELRKRKHKQEVPKERYEVQSPPTDEQLTFPLGELSMEAVIELEKSGIETVCVDAQGVPWRLLSERRAGVKEKQMTYREARSIYLLVTVLGAKVLEYIETKE